MHPSAFMGSAEASDPLYRRLADILPSTGTIVDLGCGRGRWLDFARESGLETIGVDSHAESIAECETRGHAGIVSEVFDFLHGGGTFDAISAFHLIEHLSPKDELDFLVKCTQKLRDDGLLFLVTPNFSDHSVSGESFWLDTTHIRPYPAALIESQLVELGFEIILSRKVRWTDTGIRDRIRIATGKIRFGADFGRLNTVIVGRRRSLEV